MSRHSWNPKFFAFVLLLTGVCLHSPVGYAYAIGTHTTLTEEAAARSNLKTGVLNDIGVGSLDTKVIGRSVNDWLKRGADFEDSTFPFWVSSGSWLRYRHHFYNPLNGEGYSYDSHTGYPSPSWGLEDRGDYAEQKFSLKDGYGYLLRALTLPTKAERDENFANLFETLGHTVHLVQDVAQPQHTRNDSHVLGSLYEGYTNQVANSLPFGGYPVVSFPSARDFFHTLPPGASNVLQGKGLAEYSNRGFVTTDTNFSGSLPGGSSEFPISTFINNPSFPTPNGNGVIISTLNIHDPSLLGNTKLNLQGDISFIGTNVVDTYDPSKTQPNPRTSSYSVFDADLEKYNVGGAKFSYNRFNAKEAHKFLIPRAVSYSAGLINWFFRGKIDMVKDPANASQYLIKNLGTEPLQGTFTLYYDDTSDVRKTVTGAQWNTASYTPSNQLIAGATITVPAFTPPTDAKTANTYMLVFQGKIGADIGNPAATDSLAAKTVINIRVKQLALGESHTCALIVDGAVYCWGSNSSGQLGNGETVNSATPVSVLGIGTATSVAAGFEFACATLADGAVKCWGYNANGQLGNGITGDYFSYSTPVSVLDIGAVTSVAAATHSCATLAEGGVKCWGFNSFGQLGNGTSVHSSTPVSVPGIGTATTVAAGSENTCATLADGAVKCWGLNLFGELGNGVSTVDAYGNWITPWLYSSTPVSVLGIGTATSVGVGYHHACASLADGAVKCWGSQLSNGTTVNSPTPVSVVGIGTATSVAAGASHSCAILADGTVKCWGLNSYGELGNGTTTDSSIPVTVIGLPGSP